MSDLISRQDVIKAVFGSNLSACMVYGRSEEGMATAKELIQAIKNLPSAEPERKKPDHGYMWICPECGLEVHSDFSRCVRCGWERTSADFSCDGCQTPKHICGVCRRNYPNITDHYCTGEAWREVKYE